jgi:hypothetical protein
MIYHQHGIVKNLKIKLNKYKNMKENINEHDMTKRMMDIIRNSQKPLIKEADEVPAPMAELQNAMVPGDDLPEDEPEMAKSPEDNAAEPLIPLDKSYFRLPKDDQRYKGLVKVIQDIVSAAKVTSIYLSKNNDLVISGNALKYGNGENVSGIDWTMALSQHDIETNSVGMKGDEGNQIIEQLQKILDNFRINADDTQQYLYDEQIDGK